MAIQDIDRFLPGNEEEETLLPQDQPMGNEELLAQIVGPQSPEFPRKKEEKGIMDWVTEALGITTMGNAEREGTPPPGGKNKGQEQMSIEDAKKWGVPSSEFDQWDAPTYNPKRTPSGLLGFGTATRGLGNKKTKKLLDDALNRRMRKRVKSNIREEEQRLKKERIPTTKQPDYKRTTPPSDLYRKVKRNVADVAGFGKSEDWGLERWGSAIGKGMAALGDALVQGGRGKTGFLGSVLDVEEARRKEPYEKMKDFQKMLQTEIDKERLELDRAHKRRIEKRQMDLSEKGKVMSLPGTKESKMAFEDLRNDPSKAVRDFAEKNPHAWKYMSVNSLRTMSSKYAFSKKGKLGKANTALWSIAQDPSTKPYIIKLLANRFGGNTQKAESQFNRLTGADLKKFIDLVSDQKKVIDGKYDLKAKTKGLFNDVRSASQELLKEVMKEAGINNASWDDFQFRGNRIYLVRDGVQREIDPRGFKIMGLSDGSQAGDILGNITEWFKKEDNYGTTANRVNQLIAAILAPIRKENFGASQSQMELAKFAEQIGKGRMGTEASLFSFLQRVIKKTGELVSRQNDKIRDNPIGEIYLERGGFLRRKDFTGRQFLSNEMISRNLVKEIQRRTKRGIRSSPLELSKFRQAVIGGLRPNERMYVYKEKDGIFFRPVTKFKGVPNKDHSKWNDYDWLKLYNKIPQGIDRSNPEEVLKWFKRFKGEK